jgi:hypothetical protein
MAIALRSCAMCRESTKLTSVAAVAGESGHLKITVLGMPALKCANGHASPVHRDFLLWLLQQTRERQASVAAGEAKGLLFKKYFCSCGRELPGGAGEPRSFAYDLAYEDVPGFKVELQMPIYKCGCGKEQLRSLDEMRKCIATAMVDVCDRAGFPHSG